MIVLLMGVTGVGKTTVGRALATELAWQFVDADDFHSPENIAKMRAGIPLDDADRGPWLQTLRDNIEQWLQGRESVVLACSALKAAYRDMLAVSPEVKVVYLKASYEFVARNLAERHGHFMNPSLLRSQFDTLEEPADATVVNVEAPIEQIVTQIRSALHV